MPLIFRHFFSSCTDRNNDDHKTFLEATLPRRNASARNIVPPATRYAVRRHQYLYLYHEFMHTSSQMLNERIDTLQAGRAVAALDIVAHHAAISAKSSDVPYTIMIQYGYIGVDFFFVLSGFIIAFSTNGKTLGDYAWHRIRRVFLPYLPIGLGIAILYTVFPHTSSGTRDWQWLPSLTLAPYGRPALSVAWTLQYELVFYAIFALAWFAKRMWLLAIWGLLCLLPSNLIVLKTINLEFLMGVACFYATRAGIGSKWLWLAALVPMSIWLWTGAGRDSSVLMGLSIALALPAAIRSERRGLKISPILVFFGGTSYSIYLAHGLAISLATRLSANIGWCFLAGTAGGLVYYFVVERTVMKFVPKHSPFGASTPED